jgi:hypothetical protein
MNEQEKNIQQQMDRSLQWINHSMLVVKCSCILVIQTEVEEILSIADAQ